MVGIHMAEKLGKYSYTHAHVVLLLMINENRYPLFSIDAFSLDTHDTLSSSICHAKLLHWGSIAV